MGSKYRPDWDKSCTHLICAFANTAKYNQALDDGGIIVTKDWIVACHEKKKRLREEDFVLQQNARNTSNIMKTRSANKSHRVDYTGYDDNADDGNESDGGRAEDGSEYDCNTFSNNSLSQQ